MSDVADDEGCEDEEQGHHWEGRGRAHHLCESKMSECKNNLLDVEMS